MRVHAPLLTSIAPDLDVIAERALSLLDAQTRGASRPGGTGTGTGPHTTGVTCDDAADGGESGGREGAREDTSEGTSEGAQHWAGASEATPFRLVVRESSRRPPTAK